jgi:hypothetical protein
MSESVFVPPPPIPTPAAKKAGENVQREKEKEKGEAFNEYMSFGPKHFDLFKKMQTL